MVTIITMYRGRDAEMFTQVVEGKLSKDEKDAWQLSHKCDKHHHCLSKDDCDEHNNLFFRELSVLQEKVPAGMINVDGDNYA